MHIEKYHFKINDHIFGGREDKCMLVECIHYAFSSFQPMKVYIDLALMFAYGWRNTCFSLLRFCMVSVDTVGSCEIKISPCDPQSALLCSSWMACWRRRGLYSFHETGQENVQMYDEASGGYNCTSPIWSNRNYW